MTTEQSTIRNRLAAALIFAGLAIALILTPPQTNMAFADESSSNYAGEVGGNWGSFLTRSNALGAPNNSCASTDDANENLDLSDFGFGIPNDATVTGIKVEVDFAKSSGNSVQASLIKNGVADTPNAKSFTRSSNSANSCGNSVFVSVPSGSTDLWGNTWTPADINDNDFGVRINSGNGNSDRYVDSVRITVFYTLPPPPPADSDGDGIIDEEDACPVEPETVNGFQDLDGCPDVVPPVDTDADDDGMDDESDLCPSEAETVNGYLDEDGCPDVIPPPDNDSDGIPDENDNCIEVANSDQSDVDNDGLGDLCDPFPTEFDNTDTDADGIRDVEDNCPLAANEDQADVDGDGIGDVCDTTPTGDVDGDGIDNGLDNCLAESNADQNDKDGDGKGDVCDHHRHRVKNWTAMHENAEKIEILTQNYTVPVPDTYLGGLCLEVVAEGEECNISISHYPNQNHVWRSWEEYRAIQLASYNNPEFNWRDLSDAQQAYLILYLQFTELIQN